jgi:hypothetical protein
MASTTTLDQLVRSVLIKKELPLHWYFQFLKFGSECVRELSFSTIPYTMSKTLTLNPASAVDLPCDFIDIIRVGIPQGQFVQPISQRDSVNRLINYDQTTGNPAPYSSLTQQNSSASNYTIGDFGCYWWGSFNDLGESIGRMYGGNFGYNSLWYSWIPERNQLQLSEAFPYTQIVIDYIANGECADNAAHIHPYAIQTIEDYISWQYKLHQRRQDGSAGQAKAEYATSLRNLRARLNTLDIVQIRQILQRSYTLGIKH